MRARNKTKIATHVIAGFEVEVSRKRMKNIRLKVCPPNGEIKISAPVHACFSSIESLIRKQKSWIKDQQSLVRARPNRVLQYEQGEKHSVFGVEYDIKLLDVTEKSGFFIDHSTKEIQFAVTNTTAQREALLNSWYRTQLVEMLPKLVAKWQPVIGKTVNECRVRKMRTRWGSCNIEKSRIWLSLELAKKPLECLEYVVVHEMTHLHERYHNKRFYHFMDVFLPNWRDIREQLNASPQ